MRLRRPPPLNTILHNFEGAIKEGEMLREKLSYLANFLCCLCSLS